MIVYVACIHTCICMMCILCVQLEDSFCVLRLQVLFTNLLPLTTMCSSYTDLIDLTEEPSDPELNLDDDSIIFDDAPLPAVSLTASSSRYGNDVIKGTIQNHAAWFGEDMWAHQGLKWFGHTCTFMYHKLTVIINF